MCCSLLYFTNIFPCNFKKHQKFSIVWLPLFNILIKLKRYITMSAYVCVNMSTLTTNWNKQIIIHRFRTKTYCIPYVMLRYLSRTIILLSSQSAYKTLTILNFRNNWFLYNNLLKNTIYLYYLWNKLYTYFSSEWKTIIFY